MLAIILVGLLTTSSSQYALARKHERTKELIGLLAKCDLLRHLPAEAIEQILPSAHNPKIGPSAHP